jgi:hypothetical protein
MPSSLSRGNNANLEETPHDRFLALADDWIACRTGDGGASWFRSMVQNINKDDRDDALATAIGLTPRRLGKADLSLSPGDMARAAALRPGLDPSDWSLDQLARIAFMTASYAGHDEAFFAAKFESFCTTAEVNELIALCRGLPVYPAASLLEPRAREAVRSGMKPVFEAVAHRNPYPVDFFGEDAWNQMVVKAFFIGSPMWPIQALDRRGNPRLARMLVDLAQERWAAGRPVSGEVWRCVAPHADREGMAALTRALRTGSEKERLSVALALKHASADRRSAIAEAGLQAELEALERQLAAGKIDWEALA